MKKLLLLLSITFCFLITSHAQQNENPRKVCMVFTGYLNMTAENMNVNVDSLLRLYKDLVYDKNPYYLNTRVIRHWYGNDSREVMIISELKSWDDIGKADAKNQEIIREMQKMPGMNKVGQQWFSIITPEHHSDDICYVVAE
jgi:hypothetical protein